MDATTLDTPEAAFRRASELVGGDAALARIIGITAQAISQWKRVPAARALEVERATAGKVTRYQLRPDIFGEAPRASEEAA